MPAGGGHQSLRGPGGHTYKLPAAGAAAIGGSITSGTAGSVLFVATGPVIAQDNAKFFWDDTNDRLGIGNAAPATALHATTTDAATNTVTNVATLEHFSSGTSAANYGTGLLFRGQDASGTAGGDDLCDVQAIFGTATAGSEATQLIVRCRSAGAALATVATFLGTGGNIVVPSSYRIGTTSATQMLISAGSYSVATSTFTHAFSASTAASSGANKIFTVTSTANTNQTTGTEIQAVLFNLAATRQWATGAITSQREFVISAPTYAFVGASTISTAATFYIDGPPVAGANATLTKTHPIWIDSGTPRIDSTSANGTVATVLGSLGPAGSNTTVQEWLTIDINGTTRYLPCF